jgi:hypothetical protein
LLVPRYHRGDVGGGDSHGLAPPGFSSPDV